MCIHGILCINHDLYIVMYIAYIRMEGYQDPHIGLKESSESVHGQSPRHSIGAPTQLQPQPPPAQAIYPPFM